MPDRTNTGRKIKREDCYRNAEDYTFYLPAGNFNGKTGDPSDAIENQLIGWTGQTDGYSYDCAPNWKKGPRLLACRSFQGRYWSVSGRGKLEGPGLRRVFNKGLSAFDQSGYKPPSDERDWKAGFLFPVRRIIGMIGTELRLKKDGQQGLILVAGATKSAKTLLARGLVYEVLKEITKNAVIRYKNASRTEKPEIRRPHLVTFEDPVEKWFWEDAIDCGPSQLCRKPLDYTPRQRRKDAYSLQDALRDALRQTPSLLYIGEIREDSEWRPTIEFAGTGHLVVATTHGGSLTETMVKVCKALHASTPAQRNYIADRLLGVIHVRTETEVLRRALAVVRGGAKRRDHWPKKMLIGSLWRNRPAGVHALTSGGFSSLLSAYGNEPGPRGGECLGEEYCLGECWWVRYQLKGLKKRGFWTEREFKVLEKELVCGLMDRYLEAE